MATHYRAEAEEGKVMTLPDSYDLYLVEAEGTWRIDAFRYKSKYVV